MLDTHSPNLTEAVRYLIKDSDEKHHRATNGVLPRIVKPKAPYRNRQMRERRTFYAMFGFGLLLGSLELLIISYYL